MGQEGIARKKFCFIVEGGAEDYLMVVQCSGYRAENNPSCPSDILAVDYHFTFLTRSVS